MRITSIVASLCLIFLSRGIEAQDDMWEEIEIPQYVTSFFASIACTRAQHQKNVPRIKFTFEPAETFDPEHPITVYASPPNTFKASTNYGMDQGFEYKVDSFSGQAGFKIKLPPAQLKGVVANGGDDVMIKAGFTNVTDVSATSSSTLVADLTTMHADNILLNVVSESSARVTIKTNAHVASAGVSSSGTLTLENTKNTTGTASATSSGSMSIKGDVTSVSVTSSGRLTIDGSVSEGKVTSSGSLQAGAIVNELTAESSGSILATSCDKVKTMSSGSCRVETQPSVDSVNVIDTGDYLGTGEKYCWHWDPNSSSCLGTSVLTWILFSIVALIA